MGDSYRDLVAWQRAMGLVKHVYEVTNAFPQREVYGLTNQIRRCAVSIPSNIAEGKGRRSKREYYQFLCRARGSRFELETQLEIASSLEYLSDEAYQVVRDQTSNVAKPLNGLIAALQQQIKTDES